MEERNERGETLEEFLARYDETKYRRPSNTVDMILLTVLKGKLKVLLVIHLFVIGLCLVVL